MSIAQSQGSLWEIAIAAPIANNRFRIPKLWSATLLYGETAGTSSSIDFTYDTGDVDLEARRRLTLYDRLVLGPSTSTTNPGASEEVTVVAVSQLAVNILYGLEYDYEIGDPISGYGHGLADQWSMSGECSVTNGDWRITPAASNSIPWTWGSDTQSWYCQLFTNVNSGSKIANLYQVIPNYHSSKEVYDSDAKWRMGCKYIFSNTTTGNLVMTFLLGGTVNDSYSAVIVSDDQATWDSFMEENIDMDGYGEATIKFTIGDQTGIYARIDQPFLEHALPWTSDPGYYQIPDYPDDDSIFIEERSTVDTQRTAGDGLEITNPDGWNERNQRKFLISANYSHMSQSVYDTLERYQNYQESRGVMLNLHTFIDDLPLTITGYLYLEDLGKVHEYLNLRSVRLTFEEA